MPTIQLTTFELLICCLKTAFTYIIYVAIYRPSSQPVTLQFIDKFCSLLETISTYITTTVIIGDLNLHVGDVDAPHVNNFMELLDAFGLRRHITVPTHMCEHTLDLVITAADYEPSHICVDPPVYSNHGLITCSLPVIQRPEATHSTINITTRKLGSLDRHEFSTMLGQSQVCATTLQTFADCSTADLCAAYNATLRCILDDLAPAQVLAVKHCPRSPWFDGDCRDARRLVRSLEHRYRRTKAPEDLAA